MAKPAHNKKKFEHDYIRALNNIIGVMGNGETHGGDLQKMGKKLFGPKFKGVYASNTIPKIKVGQYAIVNLDTTRGPGTHWMALAKSDKGVCAYDSFGRSVYNVLPSLQQSGNGQIIEPEKDAEQDVDEENCGQRCLAFLVIFDLYGLEGARKI